ncbi:uncharacterized protein LTHEOB_9508 [Lasiodiplodia theobromae]|uniref:uncharacterized protein n=1 Tax=Lasiodiplodia theobromae TaxID=45133 RepID=UPI0015C352AC|nr:uncharacterized protein LTHEOB_9508 [Lasiodiplodia theobromae]KAF4540034.1 hypothetical protein LTHEOB_9508 [Lasiodiplodia theobromae]
MADDSSRPPKRTRQACEGCRRKKTRCPGEQPACSLCVRLGQVCSYNEGTSHGIKIQDSDQSVSERLRSLESKMDLMLNANLFQPSPQSSSSYPPAEVLNDLLIRYEERCNYQPLPLFGPGFASEFFRTFESRDDELVTALLAIAFRIFHGREDAVGADVSDNYAARANDLVTRRLSTGGVNLATIQALCLLSFWEFTAGQKERSWLHLNLTLSLAQESRLVEEPNWTVDPAELEERRRCAWSLYVLSRTFGLEPPLSIFTCRFPGAIYASHDNTPQTPTQDTEIILANSIKLYEIWGRVQHFAAQSSTEAGKSLWTGDSEYGSIVSALMEYESQFPDEHRFSEQTAGRFKNNPAYWAPWFSIQFMYHAILCVLNHPFLLSVRLDPIKDSTPRTFRQSTSDQAKLHSYWAFRFSTVAREFDYTITDPFIAYAITVAATIFDHYRLCGETQARRDARDNCEYGATVAKPREDHYCPTPN